jgi:hypothetical protein
MSMLYSLLLTGAALAAPGVAQSAPQCSVPGHAVAILKSELPPDVLREVDVEMADPGKPYRRTDVLAPGEEGLPTMRLICGYRTLEGYVVEREQGGRGYNVGKILFRRTPTGYAPANG